ncbi:MAG: AraC family transcriptional regulator [Clostridia bacterium]|nr:AraC family transcriptional regulator [Clostridia bacterium]
MDSPIGTPAGERRGYLREDFRIFHLKDTCATRVGYHYHEFDKLVLLLSGSVTYFIEDVAYTLRPGDLLLVPHGKIHKPVIASGEPYERYVVWTSPDFLRRSGRPGQELSVCLDPRNGGTHLSLPPAARLDLLRRLDQIQASSISGDYAAELMTEQLFLLFMIAVCRVYLGSRPHAAGPAPDGKIQEICAHIDQNLSGDLSVDAISTAFFLSRYHLMRTFKAQTGYTLHQYITRRRILRAAELMAGGMPVTKAAECCGYADYSAFLRAFKQIFKTTPRAFTSPGDPPDVEQE